MPFRELLSVVGNAVKSVKSEAIKKSFKYTLFSLPQYGSRDKQEGSKRLNNLIKIAPAFEDLAKKNINAKVYSIDSWILCCTG